MDCVLPIRLPQLLRMLKKKIPSRTVNMVELSYGDFQVLQFPYVDLTWDEAKNFCDNIGIEFHQNLAY